MELWIRSQDKSRLTQVNDLYLVCDSKNNYAYLRNNVAGHLARYATKERALEVLTEIQKIISPQSIRKNFQIEQEQFCDGTVCLKPELNDVEILEFSSYVYDMPEE